MNECDEIVRKLEVIKDGEITETHVCRAVLDDAWRAMQGLEALWSGLENHFFERGKRS